MKKILLGLFLSHSVFGIEVKYADLDLAKNASKDSVWKGVEKNNISLMAQPMISPKPSSTNTPSLQVQAIHNNDFLAIRLTWKDTEKSFSEKTGQYSDAVAIQFPANGQQTTPVFMGAKGSPVHIYHWRSQYQLDKEKGKRDIKDIYPNMQVDMYPMEFADKGKIAKIDQSELEKFNPAVATGNPMSYAKTTGVDEIIAEGFGTSSVRDVDRSFADGQWNNGQWSVTIVRPLSSKEASQLVVEKENFIAFAVWQGGKDEVGSRKSVIMTWTPIKLLGKR